MHRIFCCLLSVAFATIVGLLTQNAAASDKNKTIDVRVIVLNFDPLIPGQKKRLHEHCDWYDPRMLAAAYAADVKKASGGLVNYQVVQWRDVDEFPVKKDGFRYTIDSYLDCREKRAQWHEPDLADYPRMATDYEITRLVDSAQVDELWIFGGPYFGFHESAMIGPRAFYINGGVYNKVPSQRTFAVMGFNYERGVAEMLHNLCHRTESTMSHVYGGWKAEELNTAWAQFAANLKQSGNAAVGMPLSANGESDYDYANQRKVESTADDWLDYPNLSGKKTIVSCETWGGPDYHRNYMKWWFGHLPRATGTQSDGRLNNWWRYLFEFNSTIK